MIKKRVTAHFKGRVQGVCFRAYTKQQADLHQVCGWVRNRSDGSVEALFEGDESAVQAVISACQSGPPAARVDATTLSWQPGTEELSHFDILQS